MDLTLRGKRRKVSNVGYSLMSSDRCDSVEITFRPRSFVGKRADHGQRESLQRGVENKKDGAGGWLISARLAIP